MPDAGYHARLSRAMDLPTSQSKLRVIVPIVAGVGNALLAVPMVRQLKRARPEARITIIARIDAMGEPFRRMREVEEVLITGNGFGGLWKKFRWTRARRADLYIVPFPSNRWQYNLLAFASGAGRRIMHRFPIGTIRALGFLPAERVDAVRGIHDVQQNARLLGALGIEFDESDRPVFNVTEGDRDRGDALLRSAGIEPEEPFIAIHAGSGQTILGKAKRWLPEKYAQLITMLRDEFPEHRIALLEGPDEAGVAGEILEACAIQHPGAAIVGLAVVQLTGPLGDAAAVLQRARLYIGSDSGLAHLAAAVRTTPVTIFAPADPDRVCPIGYRDLTVRPDKPCSPCFHYPWKTPYPKMLCREPMCVHEVTVEMVMDAVRRAMRAVANTRMGNHRESRMEDRG